MDNKLSSTIRRPGNGALLTMLTLALFAVQAVFMRASLAHLAGWGDALVLSALYTAVYAVATGLFARLERPNARTMLFVGATAALLMLARVAMLDYETADYTTFLAPWTQVFR